MFLLELKYLKLLIIEQHLLDLSDIVEQLKVLHDVEVPLHDVYGVHESRALHLLTLVAAAQEAVDVLDLRHHCVIWVVFLLDEVPQLPFRKLRVMFLVVARPRGGQSIERLLIIPLILVFVLQDDGVIDLKELQPQLVAAIHVHEEPNQRVQGVEDAAHEGEEGDESLHRAHGDVAVLRVSNYDRAQLRLVRVGADEVVARDLSLVVDEECVGI